MKKTLRMMGLVALAVLALAGCKKEQKNTVTFKATLPQPACDAKTHIGSGNWLMWNAGDQIKVYTADKTEATSASFTTTDADQTTADFSGTLAESSLYYAFYPTTGIELNADGKFMLPVSATQTFVESNFATNSYPMCATSTDGTFNFRSPYGILGIPMTGDATIGSIVLTDTTGMQLAGYYTMDATDTTFVGTSAAITLNFGTGVTLNTTTPTTAYFIVPAGVFQSGFNAAVRGIDGSTISNLGTIQPNTILKESIHMMPETTVNATTPTGLTNALTLEAITDGTIVVNSPQSGMQYTLNGGAKTPVSGTINVTTGDKVAFYGNGTNITSYNGTKIAGGTADVKVYGNIMSLLDEDNYATAITLTTENTFFELFRGNTTQGNTTLKDASGLLLPATTLANFCYRNMFYGCSSLTSAPALPATTLAEYCYQGMFNGCTSLTTAPALPATTLAESCYYSMFYDCSSLTAAPALPATTLADSCYGQMFYGCSSLTAAPALPATTMKEYCYYRMFQGCTSLVTAPVLPATTMAPRCYYQMFYGCTSLTTAPALPATTVADFCYREMFRGCTSLSSITCLAPQGINLNGITDNWVNGVASTGTFTKASGVTWWTGTSGIPSGWTVNEQ